jgi:hypothetical protein
VRSVESPFQLEPGNVRLSLWFAMSSGPTRTCPLTMQASCQTRARPTALPRILKGNELDELEGLGRSDPKCQETDSDEIQLRSALVLTSSSPFVSIEYSEVQPRRRG